MQKQQLKCFNRNKNKPKQNRCRNINFKVLKMCEAACSSQLKLISCNLRLTALAASLLCVDGKLMSWKMNFHAKAAMAAVGSWLIYIQVAVSEAANALRRIVEKKRTIKFIITIPGDLR